ncbi:MAG: LytTR family transcriptional regulator DNA-binding domain-containing protein, partial [Oscillospiraceae bacterium]
VALHCAGVPCELLLRDVLFVDCAAEHTRLHLMHRMILPDERVSEVFAMLSQDPRFLNCNRNVTVNMDQISKTQENTFLLKNGESVPIRQRDCGAVKRAFLQYSLRSLRKNGGI